MEDKQNIPQGKQARPGFAFFDWLQMTLLCILAAILLFNCVARLSRVFGHSMDNTLQEGQLLVIRSLGYTPKQGDIVVLNDTTAEFLGGPDGESLIKRVIATEGQTVDIDYESSTVYVDGEPLDEPYIKEPMWWSADYLMQCTHWVIPEDHIFVMGDNRNHSTDSRHDWLGPIHEDYVLGKASFCLFPPDKFGVIR